MINLDPILIGLVGFLIFLALLLTTGLPIGIGMALVGFLGIWALRGPGVAFSVLYQIPYGAIASWLLSVLPMFVLMGYVAFYAGFAKDAYDAAYKWVGRLPGGLAVATLIGAALFGACSGSSVAATATLGKLAFPEMERYNYDRRLAAGTVAMGGTLDALIPPSILLVLYGVVTEQNISELLIAGILPGILSMAVFIILVVIRALIDPKLAPKGDRFSWKERVAGLKGIIGIGVIFLSVIGGLYTGTFTPTEAGAVGGFVMFILGFAMKRLDWKIIRQIISDSLTVYSSIFLIILGAYIFVRFMALTRLPVVFAEWVVALPISPMAVFGGIVLAYLILGCFMDAIGLLLLTVPFIFIPMRALGFDLIWFGIMVVKLLEIGLLMPPLGIQTYVLKSVAPSLSLKDIVLGFLPFVIVDLFIVMGLLTLFPQIATYLPSMMH